MAWTDQQKETVINMYTKASPTPETSTEIIKDIAEEMELSPNGIRMVLVQAGVYVKKEAATTTTKTSGEGGTKRVSKESQIAALKEAITSRGGEVDEEILDKITGKAAAYFVQVINSIK